MPELAAHLERVAQLERARELSRESRAVYQKAYTGNMKRSVMQRHQDGLEAQAELLAAALAACAREEAKWWARYHGKDYNGEGVARLAALERAVGEKGRA